MPELLKTIADSPQLFEALKKHVLDEFRELDGERDSNYSDEQLGQIYRARVVGQQKVEEAFKKIARLRSVAPSPPPVAHHR